MVKMKSLKKPYRSKTTSPVCHFSPNMVLNNRKKLQKPRVKRVSWRDQQMDGVSLTSEVGSMGSGGGGGPLQDPAILMVRETTTANKSIIRYSREQLLKLRDVPAAKKRPDFLNTNDTSSLPIFDPDRWNFDKRKPSSGNNTAPSEGEGADSQQRGTIANRRSTADPRERLRKECVGGGGDGIVLSPQRRSFNSGCFVPAGRQGTTSNTSQGAGQGGGQSGRSHSPVGGKGAGDGHLGLREIQTGAPPSGGNRRIGSGRILRDSSWDYPDKQQSDAGDDYVASSKYERRSFGGGFDRDRDRDNTKDRRNNGRYGRKISETREMEEPEWFSSGPMSQNDTIELRGFEDEKPVTKKKVPPSSLKRLEKWSKKKDSQQETIDENESVSSALQANAEKDAQKDGSEEKEVKQAVDRKKEDSGKDDSKEGDKHTVNNEQGFNFDDILECQSIAGLLPNGVGNEAEAQAKSRFSRWFKQDSPEKQSQPNTNPSRHSSLPSEDDHNLIIKDLLKDISEPAGPPGDSEAYFAPISPAGNNSMGAGPPFGAGQPQGRHPHHQQQLAPQQQGQGLSIMDLLRAGGNKGAQQQQHQAQAGHQAAVEMLKQPPIAGKILSLDELEAKIRQNAEASSGIPQKHVQQHPPQKPDEDMTAAFKKLLAQAQAGGHPAASNGPMNKPQPMSLLEMLNHSQQQDEAARMAAVHHQPHAGAHHTTSSAAAHHNLMGGPTSPAAPSASSNVNSMHHLNELTLKLQQAQQYHQQQQQKQQMEMFNKLINAATSAGQVRLSPLQHELGLQQSRELLNRPEAQAILQGLKRGEITPQHLYQQLTSSALQPRHRDMLSAILKLHGYGPTPPRGLSPVPPPPQPQPPQQTAAQLAFQQQQQQQLRVSPLPPNAYCVSPILATSPNTLTVPALHQRIPSPRELQVHTQNILQRALIKKKLEEQQENYRKKQELQQQRERGSSPAISPASGVNNVQSSSAGSSNKGIGSPTPLAFTPTSVLRKMTADKDDAKEIGKNGQEATQAAAVAAAIAKAGMSQGRAVTGARPATQQQVQQQPQWGGMQFGGSVKQPVGRPIVKANNNYQSQASQEFFSQHQQQQQRIFNQAMQAAVAAQTQNQQMDAVRKQIGRDQYGYQSSSQQFVQQQQQLTQQQLRAQHQHRPANQQTAQVQQPQQQQGNGRDNAWQQFLNSNQQSQASRSSTNSTVTTNTTTSSASAVNRNSNSGAISPATGNQLARWFSPDLLERARGGELPSTAGLGQHAMSLEEIERQTAPPVHN
ncbi:unnamed protein product [Acanthoscelides obtectus]|uniref:Eukaryotic translation initiation factor 4E transporter n=1 Tax=Acanthoscelides obtectus TaxID=200917 RepID=A0A9P0LS45_ACAOB|nr:unnamed protein product [Acanthoscelides obtectus]CAK1677136.1 Eukaryotic translation initiation factor 4E transporter [Acanthoscelides obtectus]